MPNPKIPKRLLIISAIVTLLLAMLGCQSPLTGTAEPTATLPPTDTPKPVSTAADFITSNPTPTGITVTLWTVEDFSPQISLVNQTLATFQQNNPTDGVSVLLKKAGGQASALDYLQTMPTVAPELLPDVIILRDDQLARAWRTGLLQPLSGKLDRTIIQDFLPAAITLGTIDDQLVAAPLELNTEHLVVNTTLITPTPLQWQDVLSQSQNVTYRFAAAGTNNTLSDATLVQYLAVGGTFADADGNPTIDADALRAVLNYYRALLENGTISAKMLDATDPAAFWTDYKEGTIGLTHIDSHTYLNDRHQLHSSIPAAIPTQNGEPLTIVHGWVMVLVTHDPFRQEAALRLMETFLGTEANAAWASYAQGIPARRSAFDLVAADDPYWQFLDDYLNAGIAPPRFKGFDAISSNMQQAVAAVLTGDATVDEAVQVATEHR